MKRGYSKECDYWSTGVVLYEMLVGYVPFDEDSPLRTCRKILNWRETLKFPSNDELSENAKDLINSLLCEPERRLGAKRGIDEFRQHPFFDGVDWDNLHNSKPPFVPDLCGPTDVRYFEIYQPREDCPGTEKARATYLREPVRQEFVGFTFQRYAANEVPTGRRTTISRSMYENPEGEVNH